MVKEKQTPLPGTQSEQVTEIEDLITKYENSKQARMAEGREETRHKSNLIDGMKKQKMEAYNRGGLTAKLTHGKDGVETSVETA